MFNNSKQYKTAYNIIKKLIKNGFEAYLVGGGVRDSLLNLKAKDYDVATSALPKDINALFPYTLNIGAQFGVVIVIDKDNDNIQTEVATFRLDGNYTDGRRPDSVEFCNLEEDAKRRDFTINALYYNPVIDKIIDPVNGIKDFKKGLIRAIGNPEKRFNEDKLRMLRAIRFSAKYRFDIEKTTYLTITKKFNELKAVSQERKQDELNKMLLSGNAAYAVKLLVGSKLMLELIPEVSNMKGVQQPEIFHPEGDVLEHTLRMLRYMENPSLTLALGTLLHDIGKPETFMVSDRIRFNNHHKVGADITKRVLENLKYPKKTVKRVCELVNNHMKLKDAFIMKKSTLKKIFAKEYFEELLTLFRLDKLSAKQNLEKYIFCLKKQSEYNEELISFKLYLNGNDLIKLGYKPGPIFSKILNEIELKQLEGHIKSKKEAVEFVKRAFSI